MTQSEKMKISLESGISLTTIRSYLLGETVHESTRKSIEAAAARLKIKILRQTDAR